jgi:hypothetical protein
MTGKSRMPRGVMRPVGLPVKLFTVSGTGQNGAGLTDLAGAEVGDVILGVLYVGGGVADAAADVEPEISVAGKLRQIGSTDYSGGPFIVLLGEPK